MPTPTPAKIQAPKAQPSASKATPTREKRTDKMWREMEDNGRQNFTNFIAEPESMSIIAFVFVLLPTAFLLDLLNLLDLSVIGAIVPYITDFTLGLALSFGLWLAGNKDPMQLAIAGISLFICLFPALRDLFPWTLAVCAGFILSLPFVQKSLGRATQLAGELSGNVEQTKEMVEKVKQGVRLASQTSKMFRANP